MIAKRDLKINLDRLKLTEKLFNLQLKQHERKMEDQKSGLISSNQLRSERLAFFGQEIKVAEKRADLLLALMEYIAKIEVDPSVNYLNMKVVR
jgi:hypothetical protein